jgi:protein TonB
MVGHDWATHFVQALGGGAFHLVPAGELPEMRGAAAARIRVRVPSRGMDVELLPGERAALVHVDGRTRGYVEVGEVLPRLLELASEALPKDEWLRRLARDAVTSFQGDSLPERRPQDVTPAPGEYVYVEELPEAITKVPPSYPDAAREAGVDGTVLVQALVGKDGRVADTRIQKSIPMLDAAALASVRQWRFKPALGAKQQPVAVWVAVPVKFTLH